MATRVGADPAADREAWHATYGSHPHDKIVRLNSTVFEDLRLEKTKPPDAVPTPFPTLNRILLGPGGQVGLPHGHQVIVAAGSGPGTLPRRSTRRARHRSKIASTASNPDISLSERFSLRLGCRRFTASGA